MGNPVSCRPQVLPCEHPGCARWVHGGRAMIDVVCLEPADRQAGQPDALAECCVLRIGSIIINVSDMNRAAEFWGMALGYGIRGRSVNDDELPVLVPAEGKVPRCRPWTGTTACTWTCMSKARRSSPPR